MARLTIGDLAKRTTTKVETIRYYERIGLLPVRHVPKAISLPRRNPPWPPRHHPTSRNLGFSLDQVRELLELADKRDRSCEAMDLIAQQHLAEVERKIADLASLRGELIGRCRRSTFAECRVIETLAPNSA